jgi:glycosyltransferase involved in cell wall biosynthesis
MIPSEQFPVFSVIVCTLNRADALADCLATILEASRSLPPGAVELIVVDNGSHDHTRNTMQEIAASAPIDVRLYQENRKGLSWARNKGMSVATGRCMVFTDDDCRMSLSYFEDLQSYCQPDRMDTVRGGKVVLGDREDAAITIRTETISELYEKTLAPGGFIQGCNMVIPRKLADKIGEFDTRLGAGSQLRAAEDTDYIVRAYCLGIPVEYVPDMSVTHFHGRRTRDAVRAVTRNYQIGNGALYMKHLFDSPWLLKHFLWSFRNALKELFGGPKFDDAFQISHWSVVIQNLRGMIRFSLLKLARLPILGNK